MLNIWAFAVIVVHGSQRVTGDTMVSGDSQAWAPVSPRASTTPAWPSSAAMAAATLRSAVAPGNAAAYCVLPADLASPAAAFASARQFRLTAPQPARRERVTSSAGRGLFTSCGEGCCLRDFKVSILISR